MNVLMIGATGKYASLVIPALKKRNISITGLVQDEDKAQTALKNGVDKTVTGDLNDAKSLTSAVVGADAVFYISPAFAAEEVMGINMVNAAKNAGVKRFVFSSVYHP
jgi:uncharacterized protein YbjT (DUF2867 family)